MTTDNWFAALTFLAVYVICLLMLDGAHRAHISALKQAHREQVAGLRSYIRTLSRERLWLEAEVQRLKDKLRERERVSAQVEHIQWMPWMPNVTGSGSTNPEHIQRLPPSEEYDSNEE